MISIFPFSLLPTELHSSTFCTFTANLSNMKRKPICFQNNKTYYQLIHMGEGSSTAYCTKSVSAFTMIYYVLQAVFSFLKRKKRNKNLLCFYVFCLGLFCWFTPDSVCLRNLRRRGLRKKKVNFSVYTAVHQPMKQSMVDTDIRKKGLCTTLSATLNINHTPMEVCIWHC